MGHKVYLVEHSKREDVARTGIPANFSIHPYRNKAGRRQVYCTAKPPKTAKSEQSRSKVGDNRSPK